MLGPINLMRHIQSGSTVQSTGSSRPAPEFVQVCATSSGVSRLAPDSIHANPLLAGLDGQRLRLRREAAHIRELVPDINPLAYAQRHMALEGKLMNLLPELHYLEIQHLKLALGCPLHPMLSGQQESDALIADLEAYIAGGEVAAGGGRFKAIWSAHCDRIGKLLGACHSLYIEACSTSARSVEEQRNIERSHQAFGPRAKALTNTLNEEFPEQLESFLQGRMESAAAAAMDIEQSLSVREAAADQRDRLRALKDEFSLLRTDENVPLNALTTDNEILDIALKNLGRAEYVDRLKAESKNPVSALRIALGQGIPQAIASFLHFGEAQTQAQASLVNRSFLEKIAGGAAVTGSAHKIVGDGLRPFSQAVLDGTIGLGVVKADPSAVYPKALHDVTQNGRRVHRPDSERQAIDAAQSQRREDYTRVQNAWNFGTVSGDFTGFTTFGAAQALLDVVAQFTTVNASSPHIKAVASAAGGFGMASTQALAKYLQTHGDEAIPTHRLVKARKPLGELIKETRVRVLQNLDPRDAKNLADASSRILSLGEGLALSSGLGKLAELGGEAGTRGKLAHIIATYFQSGLTLQPFFANNQVTAEATAFTKANGGVSASIADHFAVALKNISTPRRKELPRTQSRGSVGEYVEDGFHIARGILQVLPQGVPALASESYKAAVRLVRAQRNEVRPEDLELGRAPANNSNPGQRS